MALAGTGLQGYLCFLLLARGFYRQFRFFSFCIFLSVVSTVALIAVQNYASVYFAVYWVSEAFSVLVTFFALQEAFHLVFRNFLSISGFKLVFPGIGVLMLGIAILRAIFHPAPDTRPLTSALISLEIAVGFLQFGIFCLFIMLVRFFQMRWRQHAFGVVFGFGVAAAGTLVVYLLRSEFGTKFNPIVRITPPIAYIIAVAIWLATFARKEPSQSANWEPALTPDQMIVELRRHTKAVKGILGR
ncbi:MAG TPA: hypothetical protein VGJ33_13575 [Candidatus Angelobacter sp.]